MTGLEGALLGITSAVVGGAVGKLWGGYKKVTEPLCKERRESYQELIMRELKHIKDGVDKLNGAKAGDG